MHPTCLAPLAGSAFSKRKPLGSGLRLNQGFLRVLLFPLFREYWADDVSPGLYLYLSLYWSAYLATLLVYYGSPRSAFPSIMPVEVCAICVSHLSPHDS